MNPPCDPEPSCEKIGGSKIIQNNVGLQHEGQHPFVVFLFLLFAMIFLGALFKSCCKLCDIATKSVGKPPRPMTSRERLISQNGGTLVQIQTPLPVSIPRPTPINFINREPFPRGFYSASLNSRREYLPPLFESQHDTDLAPPVFCPGQHQSSLPYGTFDRRMTQRVSGVSGHSHGRFGLLRNLPERDSSLPSYEEAILEIDNV